jgi:hypothetical protein
MVLSRSGDVRVSKQSVSMREVVKKTNLIAVVVFIAAIISLWVLPWLGLVLGIVVFGIFLKKKMNINFVLSLVLSLVVYAATATLVAHVGYMIGLSGTFSAIQCGLLIGIAIIAQHSRISIRDISISYTDLIHALILGGVFIFLISPLIGASGSKTIEYLRLGGEDNSSQFQMYHYVVDRQAFAYANSPDKSEIRETLTSYPQGSHAVAAFMTVPFLGNEPSRVHLLKAYAAAFALVYSITFYFFYVAVTVGLRRLKKAHTRLLFESTVAIVFTGVVSLGFFLDLFVFGFFGQIFAYLGLALVVLFAVKEGLIEKLNEKQKGDTFFLFYILLLGLFIVFASWYLLAPVAAIAVVGVFVTRINALRKTLWAILLTAVILGVVCAYLAYIYLFTTTSSGHVLTPGGVTHIGPWLLIVALPALFFVYKALRTRDWLSVGAWGMLLVAAGCTVLIGAYQLKKIDHLDYYFYKTLYTVVLIAVVLYLKQIVEYVSKAIPAGYDAGRGWIAPFLGISLIVLGGLVYTQSPANSYVELKYSIAQQDDTRRLDFFLDESLYSQYSDAFFVGSCDRYSNFIGDIWAGSLFINYGKDRKAIEDGSLYEDSAQMTQRLIDYANLQDRPILIRVIGECDQELVNQLALHNAYIVR